jgi:hypothetical protein
MLSVNRELIQLYWDIGRRIAEQQEQVGWGKPEGPGFDSQPPEASANHKKNARRLQLCRFRALPND